MGLRDVFLMIVVFGSIPFILSRPYIGILVWSWLSYMNPHKLAWGMAADMPFAQVIAITLLISILMNKDKKSIPVDSTIVLWVIFIGWMVITTAFAIYPDEAFTQFIKVVKIQIVTFLTMMLITDRDRMTKLIWVIVVSIGLFSVKGGVFTLLTGGASRVLGPPGGFFFENNSLALATLMTIPLMVYLYRVNYEIKLLRVALGIAIALSLVSVLGSQSRGALVAIIAFACFFWAKSSNKIVTAVAIIVMGVLLFGFMPESWHDRMGTIDNYEQDSSAMGRINAWTYSFNVANDRFTGGGFESWSTETFTRWAPDPTDVHAAHSIYFGILGDHGWIGLVLFLLIVLSVWRSLSSVIKRCKNRPELYDEYVLANMIQVSLVAYGSGGAFLSLSYFDLPWHLYAITVLLKARVDDLDDRVPDTSEDEENAPLNSPHIALKKRARVRFQ
jgi:putative inorganic carbon (HCO3(-)) transporter